jgi:hypothetical protein
MVKNDGCFDGLNWNYSPMDNFSRIQTVAGFDYWFIQVGSEIGLINAMKTPWPIIAYNFRTYGPDEKAGKSLTLCKTCNKFNQMSKYLATNAYPNGTTQNGITGALGEGGLFKLTRPNQKNLYIVNPVTPHMWYEGSTDGGIYFGTSCVCNPCSTCTCSVNKTKINEDYLTKAGNGFLNNTWGYDNDKLVSTDYSTIRNFWLENKISVGFMTNGLIQSANAITFSQGYTSNSVTTDYPSATLIRELTLTYSAVYPSGVYMINRTLNNIPPNTTLYVQVTANFKNGQSISGYQTITLSGTQNFTLVAADIRGQIKDYSSSVVNYNIKIYQ